MRDPKAKMRFFFWTAICVGVFAMAIGPLALSWREWMWELFPALARRWRALLDISKGITGVGVALLCGSGYGLWALRSRRRDPGSLPRVFVCFAVLCVFAAWYTGKTIFFALFYTYASDSTLSSGALGLSPEMLAMGVGGGCAVLMLAVLIRKGRELEKTACISHPCAECGYELIGNTSGVCPECGATISEEMRGRIISGRSDDEQQAISAPDLMHRVGAVMRDRTRIAAFFKRADVLTTMVFMLLIVVSTVWTVGWAHDWTSPYELWGIECRDGCVRVGWGGGRLFFRDTGWYVRETWGEGKLGCVWIGMHCDSLWYRCMYRVPLWLIWLTLVIPMFVLRRRRMARQRGSVDCRRCGYDLTGNTSSVCPECGTKIADGIRQEIVAQSSDGASAGA